jgi:membrane-associated phospholipid phosphatase
LFFVQGTNPLHQLHLAELRASWSASWHASRLSRLAIQDWLLVVYFVLTLFLVLVGAGEHRLTAIGLVAFDIAWLCAAVFVARGRKTAPSRGAEAFYRMSIVGVVIASYVQLRWILPVVAPTSTDAHLLAFDLQVFGVEPAFVWERLVTPYTTEWFAFFYFGYFYLVALHVFPITLGERDGHVLAEFALGVLTLYCVGQLLYFVVPAVGPHAYYAGAFEVPLEGGLFWSIVRDMVKNAGAGKDVFPSLHTAAPTFLAIFSFQNRTHRPFRYTWIPVTLFGSQVVIATMFLRWHYLVDVVAGIVLAVIVALLVPRVVRYERARRERLGLRPVFSGPILGHR